jgi:hypothetical protein
MGSLLDQGLKEYAPNPISNSCRGKHNYFPKIHLRAILLLHAFAEVRVHIVYTPPPAARQEENDTIFTWIYPKS